MTATSRKEGYLDDIARWKGDEEWTMKVEGRFEQFMDLLHSVTGV